MMAKKSMLCYHCGFESTENVFKYYNNGRRFQCDNCQKLFAVGSHDRPQGKTHAKQRSVDPPELKGLRRDCRYCGVADNLPFRCYNNSNLLQPCFQCLSCGQEFEMRLMGTGEERRLVHTSSYRRPPTKLGLAPKSKDDDISRQTQAAVDPWKLVIEPDVETLFPALSVVVDPWKLVLEPGVESVFPALSIVEDPWMPVREPGVESVFPALSAAVDPWKLVLEPGVETLFAASSVEDAKPFDVIEAGVTNEREAPPVLRLQSWASTLRRS